MSTALTSSHTLTHSPLHGQTGGMNPYDNFDPDAAPEYDNTDVNDTTALVSVPMPSDDVGMVSMWCGAMFTGKYRMTGFNCVAN